MGSEREAGGRYVMWVPVSHSSDHGTLRVQLVRQIDICLLRVLNAVQNIWALIYARL